MQNNEDIKELAIAAWRLEKWLNNLKSDRKMAAKSALRGIKKYIAAMDVEVIDPVGAKFDLGLAIEVVNNEDPEALEENLIIIETLVPYVYKNGELIQHARVIIGTLVKAEKLNNEIIERSKQDLVEQSFEQEGEETSVSATNITETTDKESTQFQKDEIERMMAYAKIL